MIQCDLHSEFLYRIRNIKVRLGHTVSVIRIISSEVIVSSAVLHVTTHFFHHLILMPQHSVFVDSGF